MHRSSQYITWPVIKRFLFILLPLLAVLSFITFIIYYTDFKSKSSIIKNNAADQVHDLSLSITADFKTVVSNLIFLSEHHEFELLLEGNESAKKYLAKDFLSFAKVAGLYDQMRFLDQNGMEIIRVNYSGGNSYIVPENKLQSKAKRYYFKESYRLKQGDVFVSPLDLNIEYGKLEKPLKPMIRFGTPVFDKKGNKRGVLLLHYFGEKILSELDKVSTRTPAQLLLLNNDGYFLKGSNPDHEWGFMFEDRKNITFSTYYPESWERIKNSESGQFKNNSGLYTFSTIYPISEAEKAWEPSTKQVAAKDYYWKIVLHMSSDILGLESRKLLRQLLLFYIIVLVILTIGALILSRANILKKKTEWQLVKISKAVEESPNVIIITDREGTIEYVNPKFSEITGYSAKEVLGQNPRILTSGKYPRKFFQELWDTILSGVTWRGEFLNKNKRGELQWHSVSISSIHRENDDITHFVSTQEDITERKKKDQVLQDRLDELVKIRSANLIIMEDLQEAKRETEEREANFRGLFEGSWDAIMLSTNEEFIDCNARTLEMFQCKSKEEFLHLHPNQISPLTQANGRPSVESSNEKIATCPQRRWSSF